MTTQVADMPSARTSGSQFGILLLFIKSYPQGL